VCLLDHQASASICGTRQSSWLTYCATRRKVAGSILDEAIEFFNVRNPSSCNYSPEFDSVSNGNQYQEISWGSKERLARKVDNLIVICDSIVYKI
jgi:hypothetical protein